MIVWLLLIVTVVMAYVIQRAKFRRIPPSSSAMMLGIAAGVVSRLAGLAKPLRFSPAAFFYALLPPIVFQAGFSLKKKQFFANSRSNGSSMPRESSGSRTLPLIQ